MWHRVPRRVSLYSGNLEEPKENELATESEEPYPVSEVTEAPIEPAAPVVLIDLLDPVDHNELNYETYEIDFDLVNCSKDSINLPFDQYRWTLNLPGGQDLTKVENTLKAQTRHTPASRNQPRKYCQPNRRR
ncbi:hypothetical protein V1512DRAFT_252728 [Lipomyces arxii]|uniref:uncharacterized protein n=1 Tax=Lipomyces arxii TaxID=56418 RepID=UPI0034CE0D91